MCMKHTKEERSKLYGCDGKCYWATGMCPRAEICEETRVREFVASLLAGLTIWVVFIITVLIALHKVIQVFSS